MTIKQARSIEQRAFLEIGAQRAKGMGSQANGLLMDVGESQRARLEKDYGRMGRIAERIERRLQEGV